MHRACAFFVIGWLGILGSLRAADNVFIQFQGDGSRTTTSFQVTDQWEIKWDCPDHIRITVLDDSTGLAAASVGTDAGSGVLDLPKGGTFTLKVEHDAVVPSDRWRIFVIQLPTAAVAAANAAAAPSSAGTPATNTASTAAPPAASTNATPTGANTSSLSDTQAHAIVIIKGDVAEGTGFLVHGPDGPAVVTNLHVLSANPHVKISTTTGQQITITGLKGASDRDLAMVSIKDDQYSYLDLATDIPGTVQNGDTVITPGNSEGGEVVLDTKGTVLGIGPERVEFSNPIYHGNSGGPVFHVKSGKVIAVVTQALKVRTQDEVDKASFENKNSAITGTMRYFGLRLDSVPKWETYDWAQFLNETTFISNFHDLSRCLDSYMNGARYEHAQVATADEYGPPNAQYYLKNQKLQQAHDNYRRLTANADTSQRLDAEREILMDLEGIAATDMTAIQNPGNFYAFDQIRVQQEIKYRQALEKEIENAGGKISDMGH